MGTKAATAGRTLARRLVLTARFFSANGLANHAAACAYGLLLSAAPMLLVLSFLLIRALHTTTETAAALLRGFPIAEAAFGERWPAFDFVANAPLGIPAAISMLGLVLAGRIFAVSISRGLRIVFPGSRTRSAVGENLAAAAIQAGVLVVMAAAILGSRLALRLYGAAGFFDGDRPSVLTTLIFERREPRLALLALVLYLAFRLIPANPPSRLSAFSGGLTCAILYGIGSFLLKILAGQSRYGFVYGALGELAILLIGVYFFFLCFFLGAQLAAISSSFDALLFLRLRESAACPNGRARISERLERVLFAGIDGRLERYCRSFPAGEIVMRKGERSDDVFYLLEGEVEVLLPSAKGPAGSAGILKPGAFIGEMGLLLGECRTATVVAKTDTLALALPERLFRAMLDIDTGLDRSIIEAMSLRIKRNNERLTAMNGARESGIRRRR